MHAISSGSEQLLSQLPDEARKIVAAIQIHPKVVAVLLFGSWARGEPSPISDVDIAVILQAPDPDDEAEVGSMYSNKVDVVLFHRLPLHIQFEVLKTGKELFVRDETAYTEVRYSVSRNYLEMTRFYRTMLEMMLR
jgi:hypothetical protein